MFHDMFVYESGLILTSKKPVEQGQHCSTVTLTALLTPPLSSTFTCPHPHILHLPPPSHLKKFPLLSLLPKSMKSYS
jgi:hypothetical protein